MKRTVQNVSFMAFPTIKTKVYSYSDKNGSRSHLLRSRLLVIRTSIELVGLFPCVNEMNKEAANDATKKAIRACFTKKAEI